MGSASIAALIRHLQSFQPGLVAFSGGVDSTLLLHLAQQAWGGEATAVTFLSPLLSGSEQDRIKDWVAGRGIRHFWLKSSEYRDPDFRQNPPNRCYLCKKIRIRQARAFMEGKKIRYLLDGTNADDLTVYRPGIRALREGGVISPFAEMKWTKRRIRAVSRKLGLPTWNRPSSPCLATRVAYGQTLTLSLLKRLGQGEECLKTLGFSETRLRLHGNLLRLEIPPRQFPLLLDVRRRKQVIQRISSLGFPYITLDLLGLRSGSMDETLPEAKRRNKS